MAIQSAFIFVNVILGIALGMRLEPDSLVYPFIGSILMFSISLILIWLEWKAFPLHPVETLGAFAGFSIGLLLSGITSLVGQQISPNSTAMTPLFTLATVVSFCYIGTTIGFRYSQAPFLGSRTTPTIGAPQSLNPKILDTSAIIDGRIADLCRTGFLEGPLILPQFVLLELQHVSDATDSQKRIRGKRGLEILQNIQEMERIDIQIVNDDFPDIQEVDSKLIELAKQRQAKLVTTDMNLNRVASLQDIQVLNANDLSNAIRPVVIPGESLKVFLLREGKEAGQGVAHLDDGTMVVVDHAKRLIGKQVEVVVTSVIQTSAGRMIFSNLGDNTQRLQASFG